MSEEKFTMSSSVTIRPATPADAEELLSIYAPYVEHTAITFEYEVPSVEEFRERILHTLQHYPYLVAEKTITNSIVGYVYAGPLHVRAAYAWSVETSIYVKEGEKNSGIGKILYTALEKALAAQNMTNLNACIASPVTDDEYLNHNSIQFHTHLGYSMIGEFHKCAYKFGRWYNMVWMEKMIADHPDKQPEVIPFGQIPPEVYC